MGFTFDDTDSSAVANPLELMRELIAKQPRNSERMFPYIRGDETTNSPTQSHHRFVINFGDMPLQREDVGISWQHASIEQREALFRDGTVPCDYPGCVATDYPDLLAIVENKIKGQRASHSTAHWWHFERLRKEMYQAIHGLSRVLAINCGATPWMAFTFLPVDFVFANTLAVVTLEGFRHFSLVQSRIHEVWARREASSLEDRLRYTPSDCFETFPFPAGVLERAGGVSPTTDHGPLTTAN